jgi:hypothetical protein
MMQRTIITLVFLACAVFGIIVGLSAPQMITGDEQVYLLGALQKQDGDLPDARMLTGYDYGPYLQPNILLAFYEPLGNEVFKSALLAFLSIATLTAGYFLFRTLGLAWVPSLALSVVALIPRIAAGTEFWGALSFREAIGRSVAVPFFLLSTAFLLRRVIARQATWPVFGLIGLFLFLHPVTTTLFAFVALIGVGITRLVQKTRFVSVVREVLISGLAFLGAGSYFFVDVVGHLSENIASAGVTSAAYVSAILFRNPWEFAPETFLVYRQMLLVSVFFLALIAFVYLVPRMREIRKRFHLASQGTLLAWGLTVMIASQVLALLIPAVNLWLMQNADASYAFQQWSRISKFYYLGLFVALVPTLHILWGWYRQSRFRKNYFVPAIVIGLGLLSSSFAFEVAQYLVGYKNYTQAYIPKALSGIADGITPAEYRETCRALAAGGITSATELISSDFGLRYFCKANLYVTAEEGAAYTYLTRAELVWWHHTYLAQREALREGDLEKMHAFAKDAAASFLVLRRQPRYEALEAHPGAYITMRHLVIPMVPY